jgi:hypothetical protein
MKAIRRASEAKSPLKSNKRSTQWLQRYFVGNNIGGWEQKDWS